jgi:hypothetical protein
MHCHFPSFLPVKPIPFSNGANFPPSPLDIDADGPISYVFYQRNPAVSALFHGFFEYQDFDKLLSHF